MDKDISHNEISDRTLRVFVSSTFQDMHAERDELVKHVFPKIRKLCEERDVFFSEVDLRWGVTEEQKSEDQVLPLCFTEIERCRPYFIGLLGERYGWIPDKLPKSLLNEISWLKQFRDRSVTEIEIQHAILDDEKSSKHAHFYFRDKRYINSIDADEQALYLEVPTLEEIEKHGEEQANKNAQDRSQKLANLKQSIRNCGLPLRENYCDARELGKFVLEDLTRVVEQEFPLKSRLKPAHQNTFEHRRFAQQLLLNSIPCDAVSSKIGTHLESTQGPILLTGESGCGKSTLLAENYLKLFDSELFTKDQASQSIWKRIWSRFSKGVRNNPIVVAHFVGATSASSTWQDVALNLFNELARQSGTQQKIQINEHPDDVRENLEEQLEKISKSQRVMMIIDGLDQLEFIDDSIDLRWLPTVFPQNVSAVFSASPGKVLNTLLLRSWTTIPIPDLELDERKNLIRSYLSFYGKELSPFNLDKISAPAGAGNPRFLNVLLEELRIFGSYEKLNHQIELYLQSSNTEELYLEVLKRYESDYERDFPQLVSQSMSMLWAARQGLSEVELLSLLGTKDKPLPRLHWSPLSLAIEKSLTTRSGLLNFSNQALRRAVQRKYLEPPRDQSAAHLRLARYFNSQSINKRRVDEELWHSALSGNINMLSASLLNIELFLFAKDFNTSYYSDWKRCWTIASQAESPGKEVRKALQQFAAKSGHAKKLIEAHLLLGSMLHDMGYSSDAEQLLKQADELMESSSLKDKELQESILTLMGRTLQMQDKFEEAIQKFEKLASQTWKPLRGSSVKYAQAIGAKAGVLFQMGKYEEAIPLFEEAIKTSKLSIFDDDPDILGLEGNLALSYSSIGRYTEAEQLARKILALETRAFGENHLGTVTALSRLAGIYSHSGKYQEALKLYSRGLAIREEKLNPDHPSIGDLRHNIAGIYMVLGRSAEAVQIYERCVNITRHRLGSLSMSYALSLAALGEALVASKNYQAAIPILKESHEIFNQIAPDQSTLANCLRSLGKAYIALNQSDHAISALMNSIDLLKRTVGKFHAETAISLTALGHAYWTTGERQQALNQLKQAREIFQKVIAEPHHVANNLASLVQYSKLMGLERERIQYQEELDSYRRQHNLKAPVAQPTVAANSPSQPNRKVEPEALEVARQYIREREIHARELAESEITTAEFFQGWLSDIVNAMAAFGGAVWFIDNLDGMELIAKHNLPQSCLPEHADAILHKQLLRFAGKQDSSIALRPGHSLTEAPELRNPTEFLLLLKNLPLQSRGAYLVEIAQRENPPSEAIKGYVIFLDRLSKYANSFLQRRYQDNSL